MCLKCVYSLPHHSIPVKCRSLLFCSGIQRVVGSFSSFKLNNNNVIPLERECDADTNAAIFLGETFHSFVFHTVQQPAFPTVIFHFGSCSYDPGAPASFKYFIPALS